MVRQRVITAIAGVLFLLFALLQRRILTRYGRNLRHISSIDETSVKSSLLGHLRHMQKLALPTIWTREGCGSMVFIALFAIKAIATVMKSEADGRVIETMVSVSRGHRSQVDLARSVFRFSTAMLLSSAVTSAIEHLRFWLIASYRERLTAHFHSKFFDRLTFYYGSQLDDRLEAADTVIPVYCHEFAEHFAELPYYFVMPLFEAITALVVVVRRLGPSPAGYLIGSVTFSLFALRALTPPFGKIHALLLNREEAFRRTHTDVHANVEQVAFLAGGGSVKERANRSFLAVADSLKHMACARGHFQLVESTINGCWEVMGLLLSNMLITNNKNHMVTGPHPPPGGSGGKGHMLSAVVVQRRLVQDFHQAVTALVVNVKEVSHLSEFTEKLALFDATLDSVARGELVIKRNIVDRQQEEQQSRLDEVMASKGITPIASCSTLDCQDENDEDAAASVEGASLNSPSSCSLQNARDTWNVPELQRTRSGFVEVSDTNDNLDVFHSPMNADWDVSRLSPALGQATYLERSVVMRNTPLEKKQSGKMVSLGGSPPNSQLSTPPFGSSPTIPSPSHVHTPILTRLKSVTVANPHGRILIPDLNMSIREGDRWAIIGPNGSGKSSVLRVLAKMWLPTTGVVETSRSVRYLFLPQSPYFPPSSTLAEQITFPHLPKLVVDTFRKNAPVTGGTISSSSTTTTSTLKSPNTTAASGGGGGGGGFSATAALSEAFNALAGKYGSALDSLTSTVVTGMGLSDPKSTCAGVASAAAPAVSGGAADAVIPESSEEVLQNNLRLRASGQPLTVCPKQQRRMREAMSLATGAQFLEDVFGGWGSPVAGLLDPHQQWSGGEEDSASAAATVRAASAAASDASPARAWGSSHTLRGEVLAVGADRSFDWYSLSGGQQQKLSLARAFYHILRFQEEGDVCGGATSLASADGQGVHSPNATSITTTTTTPPAYLTPSQISPVMVMDESTSQMDFASEDLVFKHLSKKNVTLVSVTHRPEVVVRHDHILEIVFDHVDVPAADGTLATQSVVVPRWLVRRN